MTSELTKAAQQALKPCPFCGSTNIKVHSYSDAVINGEPDAFAQCHDCSVTGPNGKTEAEAAEAWNTRTLTQRPASTYTAPAPAVPSDERAAFEAWARPHGYDLRRNDMLGHYSSLDTLRAWEGWQARAALTAAPTPSQAPAVPSDVLREMREFGKARMAEFMGAHHMALVLSKKINEWADKLTAAPTPPAQSEPTDLTGCNCRWKGGAQVEWCEHHLAHRDAIHDWAQRAKIAEAKLTAATPAVPSLQPACRYISEVLAGDAPSGEKHIARTIMHLLPLEQAMQATPAVPEDVAREPMTQRWCWWLGDAETFHVANTESEAHSEAQSRIDDDCEPGDTREYSVGRVQHPIDALGVEWLAEHVAETIEENTREWCDDNTGAEDPSITLAAEDRKVLGTMVAAFLREKVSVHWWTADQKTITTHTYVAGSSSAIDAARAAEKGGA